MGKGARYMETLNAKVINRDEKYFIEIGDPSENILIPISEDNPNDIKSTFNKLIVRLKEGEFKIDMPDVKSDLFSLVANEYIKQLNTELVEVYNELKQHKLIE